MKKALVVVSFGISKPGDRSRGLHPLAALAADQWPEYSVYQAYTSAVMRSRLAAQDLPARSLSEVLEQLSREGVGEVCVCPALLSFGSEYGKILREMQQASAGFSRLVLSPPLLAGAENRQKMADILSARFPAGARDEGYLLVGHGSKLEGNECYAQLERTFHRLGRTDMHIALLVGQPGMEEAIAALKRRRIACATIVPILLTAGKHVMEDLAGDGPDSCRRRLEREELQVKCITSGLIEYPEMRQLYVEHFSADIAAN